LLVLRDTGTITPAVLQPITPQDQIFGTHPVKAAGKAE